MRRDGPQGDQNPGILGDLLMASSLNPFGLSLSKPCSDLESDGPKEVQPFDKLRANGVMYVGL